LPKTPVIPPSVALAQVFSILSGPEDDCAEPLAAALEELVAEALESEFVLVEPQAFRVRIPARATELKAISLW